MSFPSEEEPKTRESEPGKIIEREKFRPGNGSGREVFMDGWNRILDDIDDLRRRLAGIRRRIVRLKQAGGRKAVRYPEGPKEYPTALGRNIDMLRLELGWSFNDLERLSGIGKKRILDYVNKGAKPRPQTLKDLADTFTKAFGHPVSVADLHAEMGIMRKSTPQRHLK